MNGARMKYDVVVIGASTSGLFAAEKLAISGKRVAVFERQDTLAPERRTYIITPHIEKVMGELPESAIIHRIDKMEVETKGNAIVVPLRTPDLIIERNMLTIYLAEQAKKAGVEFYFGYRFKSIVSEASNVSVLLSAPDKTELKVETCALIGADGAFSDVGVASGLQRPPTVKLLQAEISLPGYWDPSITKVWFDVQKTPYFYWLIPESETRAVVGLIASADADVRSLLDNFLEEEGFNALAYQAGKAAMHHPGLSPWTIRNGLPVYLVGDSAGQVKVTTVGGSVTGFWGAVSAAEEIIGSGHGKRRLRALKRELDVHWLIRLMLEQLDNNGYDILVGGLSQKVIGYLGKKNRDEMAYSLWVLPILSPKLLFVGALILGKMISGKLKSLGIKSRYRDNELQ